MSGPQRYLRRMIAVTLVTDIAGVNTVHAHGEHASTESVNDRSATKTRVKEQKALGIAGDTKAVRRTVNVTMLDSMRFAPDAITVRVGETLRIRVHNTGTMLHEFVIGTPADNAAHAELMLKHPGMEHDEPYMAHVAPGKTGEIVWQFNRAGEFEFACLIAGHYQAGMRGTLRVLSTRGH